MSSNTNPLYFPFDSNTEYLYSNLSITICPVCNEEVEDFMDHIFTCPSISDMPILSFILMSNGHFVPNIEFIENNYEMDSMICERLGDVNSGLSEKNIQDISWITYIKDNHTKCSICLELNKNKFTRQLNCDHLFCDDCIREWFKFKNTCPVCKKKFESDNLNNAISNLERTENSEVQFVYENGDSNVPINIGYDVNIAYIQNNQNLNPSEEAEEANNNIQYTEDYDEEEIDIDNEEENYDETDDEEIDIDEEDYKYEYDGDT